MSELSIEKQSTPKISVIVPVYNVEKYIHQCIDSILGQTFTDFELLLIDDGSPDNSGAICDEYAAKDSRVRVFHQENAGVSVARNKGIDEAVGEWISFVDSDDWIDSDFYEAYFCEMQNKNVDIVFAGFKICTDNNVENKYVTTSTSRISENISVAIQSLIKSDMFGWICNKLFRKQIIVRNRLQFNKDIKLSEDQLFTLEYCQHISNIVLLSGCGYNYRILPNSLIHQPLNVHMIMNKNNIQYDEMVKISKRFGDESFAKFASKYLRIHSLGLILSAYMQNVDSVHKQLMIDHYLKDQRFERKFILHKYYVVELLIKLRPFHSDYLLTMLLQKK